MVAYDSARTHRVCVNWKGASCFTAAGAKANSRRAARPSATRWCTGSRRKQNHRLCGIAAAADEAEILSIAVAASHRGRGLSRNPLPTHLGHLPAAACAPCSRGRGINLARRLYERADGGRRAPRAHTPRRRGTIERLDAPRLVVSRARWHKREPVSTSLENAFQIGVVDALLSKAHDRTEIHARAQGLRYRSLLRRHRSMRMTEQRRHRARAGGGARPVSIPMSNCTVPLRRVVDDKILDLDGVPDGQTVRGRRHHRTPRLPRGPRPLRTDDPSRPPALINLRDGDRLHRQREEIEKP